MNCPRCQGPTIQGFTSFYCKNECDRKPLQPYLAYFSLHTEVVGKSRPRRDNGWAGLCEMIYPGYARVGVHALHWPMTVTWPKVAGHLWFTITHVGMWQAGQLVQVWETFILPVKPGMIPAITIGCLE